MAGNKLTIGNVDIYGIADTVRWSDRPLGETFPSDHPVEWNEQARRYPDTFGEGMTWREDFGSYLVRSQGRTLLVDTGVGPASSAFARNLGHGGELLQKLGSIGVRVEDVDIVVFTHLHPDHVGWNTTEDGGKRLPTFPNALYIVQRADWEAVQGNEASPRRPYVDDMLVPLEAAGVIELIEGERALTSEISTLPTPGHTPGHMSIVVASGGQHAVILGDVAAHPVQIDDPDVDFVYDADTSQARATRRKIYDRIEALGMTLAASHFPEPGFGEIVRVEGKRRFRKL